MHPSPSLAALVPDAPDVVIADLKDAGHEHGELVVLDVVGAADDDDIGQTRNEVSGRKCWTQDEERGGACRGREAQPLVSRRDATGLPRWIYAGRLWCVLF